MQTYTHALLGGCLGIALFPQLPSVQFACIAGSVLPDVVQMPKYLLDKMRNKKPLEHVPNSIVLLKNMAHSLLFWGALSLIAWYSSVSVVVACCIGGLVHCMVDALTHCDPKYKYDAGFLWPLNIQLADYTGIWDYRIDHGVLWPKLPEAIVDAAAVTFILLAYLGPQPLRIVAG